jgi:hypothetical protein
MDCSRSIERTIARVLRSRIAFTDACTTRPGMAALGRLAYVRYQRRRPSTLLCSDREVTESQIRLIAWLRLQFSPTLVSPNPRG